MVAFSNIRACVVCVCVWERDNTDCASRSFSEGQWDNMGGSNKHTQKHKCCLLVQLRISTIHISKKMFRKRDSQFISGWLCPIILFLKLKDKIVKTIFSVQAGLNSRYLLNVLLCRGTYYVSPYTSIQFVILQQQSGTVVCSNSFCGLRRWHLERGRGESRAHLDRVSILSRTLLIVFLARQCNVQLKRYWYEMQGSAVCTDAIFNESYKIYEE